MSGYITEIAVPDGKNSLEGFITLRRYVLGNTLHTDFEMPVLRKPSEGSMHALVRPKVCVTPTQYKESAQILQGILFIFSAQHDCRLGDCRPSLSRPEVQERQATNRMVQLIGHNDDLHFVLNMHALHNATLIRKILPPHLTLPTLIYPDREARHFELATKLRVSQAEKRAATKAKRAATKNANLAKKAAQQAMRGEANADAEDEESDT